MVLSSPLRGECQTAPIFHKGAARSQRMMGLIPPRPPHSPRRAAFQNLLTAGWSLGISSICLFSEAPRAEALGDISLYYLPPRDIEIFALFISCMCHDLDHRGTNNSFQVASVRACSPHSGGPLPCPSQPQEQWPGDRTWDGRREQ